MGSGNKEVFSYKKRKKMLDKFFGDEKITKEDKEKMDNQDASLKSQTKDFSPTFN